MSHREEEPWDLVIGRVTAPFGVRGEMRVKPETDFPDRFLNLREVCLELPNREERRFAVARARVTPKGIILALAGCESRDQAEALRRSWVKIRPSLAVALPQGSYWVHDIMGMRVVTETGEDLGEVTEVIRAPGNDVYVTPKAMIPALREVVREIDVATRRMVVSLPPVEEAEE